MAPLTRILQSIERRLGNEIPLWHGTGVHPDELAKGAGTLVEPKFSDKFLKTGTGGNVQGPGLYGTEEQGDADDIYSILKSVTEGSQYKGGFVPGYQGNAIIEDIKHGLSSSRIAQGKDPHVGIKDVIDVFGKAGFEGTKYRGDAQQAGYFNYVLQHPERARIIDAFKFGLPLAAGVGMSRTGEES